jgi:hypothetical protein
VLDTARGTRLRRKFYGAVENDDSGMILLRKTN